jgi:hypothetical protein
MECFGMFWNDLWGPERSYVCGSGSFLSIFQSSSSEGMKLTPMKKGILEVVIITQVNDVGMSFFSWKTSCGEYHPCDFWDAHPSIFGQLDDLQ